MNKLLVILLAVTLSGCAWFGGEKPRDIVVVAGGIDTCSTPPKADKIITRNVNFKIIVDEYGIYWIGITPKHYENLSVNMKEIIQHIKQKNAIVKYYRTCHEDKKVEEDVAK